MFYSYECDKCNKTIEEDFPMGKAKSFIKCKCGGEKHKDTKRKKKDIAPIDIEKLESINEFVEYSVTESRLNQAIENVFNGMEIDIKKLGQFIKWMHSDIMKEESDTMLSNNLEPKDVNKSISTKARKWFLEKYNAI